MSKKEIIEIFNTIRRDDKDTINKLISMNERILFELRDLISETRTYFKELKTSVSEPKKTPSKK